MKSYLYGYFFYIYKTKPKENHIPHYHHCPTAQQKDTLSSLGLSLSEHE